jgi:hypothetical protein
MAVNLSLFAGAGAQFFDNSGVPLAGGLVYTYTAGTTTPQAAYTTSSGSTPHTNPIVLDSAGRVPSGGEIWLTDAIAYKFILKTSTAVLIATYDNVTGNASGIYAAFAASSGSSLVGYLPSGTGAVATTVQAKLRQTVNVIDFGAIGNGVADDTTAIKNAITYLSGIGGGNLLFPVGTFNISLPISITAPISLIGSGDGWRAFTTFSATTGTTIKYVGSIGATMFTYTNINYGGVGMQNILLSGNNLANIGMILDGVVGGFWQNIGVLEPVNIGIKLQATIGTTSWNTFTNIAINCLGNSACLYLTGSVIGGGNTAHNSFNNLQLNFGSTSGGSGHGIYLGNCDNNYFAMTYIYAAYGLSTVGYGVYCDPTELANFPIGNHFYHLQASVKGWYQPSTTLEPPAIIFGYARDNGQPAPVTNGTALNYTMSFKGNIVGSPGFSLGLSTGNNFVGEAAIPIGSASLTINFPYGPEPDANYYVYLSPKNITPPGYYTYNPTASGFSIQLSSAQAYIVYFNWIIIRI